jgi:hypothetical protein
MERNQIIVLVHPEYNADNELEESGNADEPIKDRGCSFHIRPLA